MKRSLCLLPLLLLSCSVGDDGNDGDSQGNTSETHWMQTCDESQTCIGEASCVCGICTLVCDDSAECRALGERAKCTGLDKPSARLVCGPAPLPFGGVCLFGCDSDLDCASGEGDGRCVEGRCVVQTEMTPEATPNTTPAPTPVATPPASQSPTPNATVEATPPGIQLPNFATIDAGDFTMGAAPGAPGRQEDEQPRRIVTLTRAFGLMQTELTRAQWAQFFPSEPWSEAECGGRCPVDGLSWWDALALANAYSESLGVSPCYQLIGCNGGKPGDGLRCTDVVTLGGDGALGCDGFRLPTEAEWEYAARADAQTHTPAGNLEFFECDQLDPTLDAQAWYCGNSDVAYRQCADEDAPCLGPHPVAQKDANGNRLWDMLGNVAEWVFDRRGGFVGAETEDPVALQGGGDNRVVRGGSFDSPSTQCRVSSRGDAPPDEPATGVGMRLARSVIEPGEEPTPLPSPTPVGIVSCQAMRATATCPAPGPLAPACTLEWLGCSGGNERRIVCQYSGTEAVTCDCIANGEVVQKFDFPQSCPWTIADAPPEALELCGWEEFPIREPYPTPWPGIVVPCP